MQVQFILISLFSALALANPDVIQTIPEVKVVESSSFFKRGFGKLIGGYGGSSGGSSNNGNNNNNNNNSNNNNNNNGGSNGGAGGCVQCC